MLPSALDQITRTYLKVSTINRVVFNSFNNDLYIVSFVLLEHLKIKNGFITPALFSYIGILYEGDIFLCALFGKMWTS